MPLTTAAIIGLISSGLVDPPRRGGREGDDEADDRTQESNPHHVGGDPFDVVPALPEHAGDADGADAENDPAKRRGIALERLAGESGDPQADDDCRADALQHDAARQEGGLRERSPAVGSGGPEDMRNFPRLRRDLFTAGNGVDRRNAHKTLPSRKSQGRSDGAVLAPAKCFSHTRRRAPGQNVVSLAADGQCLGLRGNGGRPERVTERKSCIGKIFSRARSKSVLRCSCWHQRDRLPLRYTIAADHPVHCKPYAKLAGKPNQGSLIEIM